MPTPFYMSLTTYLAGWMELQMDGMAQLAIVLSAVRLFPTSLPLLSSPLLSPAAFSFLLVHLSPGNGTASCLGEISNHRDGLAPDRNSPQQPPPRGPKNTGLLKGNGGKRGGREGGRYHDTSHFLKTFQQVQAGGRKVSYTERSKAEYARAQLRLSVRS